MVQAKNNVIAVTAYGGDAKTLLAFDLNADSARTGLAGFTIEVHPPGADPYYLGNNLRLAASPDHAQVAGEPPHSAANAPIQKFRWAHVPGMVHQGETPHQRLQSGFCTRDVTVASRPLSSLRSRRMFRKRRIPMSQSSRSRT